MQVNALNVKITAAFLAASFALTSPVWAKDLPDACGNETIHFIVTTSGNQPLPESPPPGKAQVIFIETIDRDFCLGCSDITTRVGIDGAWVGANKGKSHFSYNVEPGKHRICADWQRILFGQVSVDSFTAQPGKSYYFMVRVTNRTHKTGDQDRNDERVRLIPLGEAEGRRLVSQSDLSLAELHK
jgi:hypothetical protein